jgi:Phosphate-selective porin O and P
LRIMEFLIRCFSSLALLLTLVVVAQAEDRALVDFTFAGYLQGRVIGHMYSPDHVSGLLSTGSEPNQASGEKETSATIKRAHFELTTILFNSDWNLVVSSGIDAKHAHLEDAYIRYTQNKNITWRAGQCRAPFGLEPQTSSADLDTLERALMYEYGNFGWVGRLGLGIMAERSSGLRLDVSWPKVFAGLTPEISAAVMSGNGKNTKLDLPTQGLLRFSVSSVLQEEEIHHIMNIGISGAYGRNRFLSSRWEYMPIGSHNALFTGPDQSITTDVWETYETVMTLGADGVLRMNELVIKAEYASREFHSYRSLGYYVTAIFELRNHLLLDLDLVARWEEAKQGYADGVHLPDQPYQAATVGITWRWSKQWKFQINYLAVYLELIPHAFPGSDVVLGQVQVNF